MTEPESAEHIESDADSMTTLPGRAFRASVTARIEDFNSGVRFKDKHRGLNLGLFAGQDTQWDLSRPGNTALKDVFQDQQIIDYVRQLGLGSVRIPGGGTSNCFDYRAGQSWEDWAVHEHRQYNMDVMPWENFWQFHNAIGQPDLVATANVYSSGNRDYRNQGPTWINASQAGDWVADFRDQQGLTGLHWEGGNEVYIGRMVPGLNYPGDFTTNDDYVKRFCDVSQAIKAQDPNAQVGIVLYEFGLDNNTWTVQLMNALRRKNRLDDFDFFIIHDYAPLVPRYDPKGQGDVEPVFYQEGVDKALAFQNLTHTVKTFRDWLRANYDASQTSKPIYITEYGTLHYNFRKQGEFNGYWLSDWYDKGVAILLINHYLQLIIQGADGLWYWETFGKMFRIIDPDAPSRTSLYFILQKLFSLRGKLIELNASGGQTFTVHGPVGSGCVEHYGNDSDYWRLALASGKSRSGIPYLKVYAVFTEHLADKQLTIIALNFGFRSQELSLTLEGALATTQSSRWDEWQVSATGWNNPLSSPSTTQRTINGTSNASGMTIGFGAVPARSATIFELGLGRLP